MRTNAPHAQPDLQGLLVTHPQDILLGPQAGLVFLPVCDHYCGVEPRISKSLALQRQMSQELGACVFGVTLDCEDGAPVGGELEHANMLNVHIARAFGAIENDASGVRPIVGVRVHAADHPSFASDVTTLVGAHAARLSHLMLPKAECLADVQQAVAAVDAAGGQPGGAAGAAGLPVHLLVESSLAVGNVFDMAAHPRVQSISFGLMDFVSSHGGAIGDAAMGMGRSDGQFAHPLVVRAKLEIAAACHAFGKVPSHCVVTEFADLSAVQAAAHQARSLGYTRMWSIHPAQIRPILKAFAPSADALDKAAQLLLLAQQAAWAPIRYQNTLHDRASYRLYWQQLQRGHAAGLALPQAVRHWFLAPSA